jgi:hypothetical protein
MGFSWMISHGDLPSRLALHPAHEAHCLGTLPDATSLRSRHRLGAGGSPNAARSTPDARGQQANGKQMAPAVGVVGGPPVLLEAESLSIGSRQFRSRRQSRPHLASVARGRSRLTT